MKVWYLADGNGQLWNGHGFSPVRKQAVPFYCKHCAGGVLRTLDNSWIKYPGPLRFEERVLTEEEETWLVKQLADAL